MSDLPSPRGAGLFLQRVPALGRWAILIAASVLAATALLAVQLSAALMLGPLIAAVAVQTAGGSVKVPRPLLAAAQAIVGCLIARSITASTITGLADHWLIFPVIVGLTIAGSAFVGWALSRLGVIPGTAAVWGMLPGAASAMTIMAEAHGQDFRLVAFMQYTRVVLVAGVASGVASAVAQSGGPLAVDYFPPVHWWDFAATAAIGCAGAGIGLAVRLPAGALLVPLLLGATLNALGLVRLELPPVVLIASYALIGWNIGLHFTRDVLAGAARALPQCIGAAASLILFCGLLAWLLVEFLHIDPLTAYLATSPGGVDVAAIIAASTRVDMGFVMALQMLRVIVLLFLGPHVARWIAGTVEPQPSRASAGRQTSHNALEE